MFFILHLLLRAGTCKCYFSLVCPARLLCNSIVLTVAARRNDDNDDWGCVRPRKHFCGRLL